jgi:hypothetical protein
MLKTHVYFFVQFPVLNAVNECQSYDSNCQPFYDDMQTDTYNLQEALHEPTIKKVWYQIIRLWVANF